VAICPACGGQNPERAKFCLECGVALADQPAAATLEERKVVSVLFCDLVGFTAASEAADPEDVRARLRPYHARLREEIERHGGTVEKFVGDAVMAVFGAPVAHEDDAERAVRAGLEMQAAMGEINEPLERQHGVTFELCVGINTGEVLAGRVGDGYTVVGDSVNVAARLQAAARPGSVTVCIGRPRKASRPVHSVRW